MKGYKLWIRPRGITEDKLAYYSPIYESRERCYREQIEPKITLDADCGTLGSWRDPNGELLVDFVVAEVEWPERTWGYFGEEIHPRPFIP